MFLSRATPITFIGDSHTLAFSDLVFRDAADGLVITRSHYCRGITASAFLGPDGAMHADVVQALLADGFVERHPGGLVARHRAGDLHALQVGVAMERPPTAPVLVFSVGDIDLKFGFIREFAAADFTLPPELGFDAAPFAAEPAAGERVPYALVASFVQRLAAPYLRGLVSLARLGFDRIFLLVPPPPTLDDDAFERINGFRAPARLRYKATRAFNAALRAFTRDYPEFGLLDVWDRVTTAGVIDPAYRLDDSHLNRRGALLAVGDLLAEVDRRAGAAVVGTPPVPRASVTGARFAQDGIFALDLGADAAAGLRALLAFAPEPDGAAVRAGWAGEGLGGSRCVAAVRPDAALLARCEELLRDAAVGAAIVDCVGSEHVLAILRILKTLPPADAQLGVPPLFARDGTPPGAVRGIFYLTGVPPDAEPLVFAARSGAAARLRPDAGTLVLYDPRRIEHRESLAGAETVDVLIVPTAAGGTRIVAPGSNNFWPR